MRKLPVVLSVFLTIFLGLVVFANRALFFPRFDQAYWQDRYEHSQWKLPFSPRVIGDDGLYLYEGYRLVHGGDPTSLNAEMPPLGKYLLGITLVLFQNGALFGLWTTGLLLLGTFLLTKKLFPRSTLPALAITTLLAADPLITNQYTLTMMDSLQSAFLVFFLFVLFQLTSTAKKNLQRTVILSGMLLGLFSAVKAPLLSPIIALVGLSVIWTTTKTYKYILWFFIAAGIFYLAPYIPYFLQGHTLIEWLKVQKWIISFYIQSNLAPTWGSALSVLFTGRYQNIFSRTWISAPEWNPLWGLLFLSGVGSIFFWLSQRKRNMMWGVISGTLFVILGAYAAIPFWTRYLVVILPLLYIVGGHIATKLSPRVTMVLFGVAIIINLFASSRILFPTPQTTVSQFIYAMSHQLFADLYEDTTASYKHAVSREAFRAFGLQTFSDGEIEHIDMSLLGNLPVNRRSPYIATIAVTYYTRNLGPFTENIAVPFVLEDNRWRIPWQWSYILPGLTEKNYLETTLYPARRGNILASDKKPLAEDIDGVMVWVTPKEIDKTQEEKIITSLEALFEGRIPRRALHYRMVGNVLPDRRIPIGVLPYRIEDPKIQSLSRFTGLSFTTNYSRVIHANNVVDIGTLNNSAYEECCSYLYSTTNYDGITGVEKQKNSVLKGKNGGTLKILTSEGVIVRTLLSITKHDGIDTEP